EQLYVDNGAVFASDHLKRICGRVGIHLSHSTVRRPAGRGKIERLFRFIDTSFVPEAYQAIDSGYIETLDDLNDAFQTWANVYYHERKHGSTGMAPKQRAAQTTRRARRISEQELTEIFYWQEERKADKAGCVSLQGNLFQVDDELANKKVQLRYDPFDLTTIQVWYGEHRYADAAPIDLTRRYDRRVQQEVEASAPPAPGISMFEALKQKQRVNAEGLRFAESGDVQ
ncbi:Mu transposase C-terminal domain-containing protein, partial [Ferroacidibacillus organovorans]|uniref:Mu transposase C-terminal domain-containing protein n=1 Tax=Ferroacidibacillus organovorans TaxID=1765683 RepID=UPI0013655CFF